ncbi:leucine-rich repeat, cysteine-containing subtype protein [Tanacetum coccineum]
MTGCDRCSDATIVLRAVGKVQLLLNKLHTYDGTLSFSPKTKPGAMHGSASLCYEIDGITRKRVTIHTRYYPNPASLSKRFPFIEALTLKGPPSDFVTDDCSIRITPWIEQLAHEFRCLKELHIRLMVFHNKDLETLARTRGKDLRSLKLEKCKGFSTDGLRHVSNYCNQLRTFCLKHCCYFVLKDDNWLHQLALNSTALERLHVTDMGISHAEDLTLLARKCCNSLISLKIGVCYLSKLGDALRFAVRLERFGGYICDEERKLVGVQFPPSMRSLNLKALAVNQYSKVLPFLNQIRKLKLVYVECQCSLFKRCPNLEVLYAEDVCGDRGLQKIGQFCKKLRKLNHYGLVTHMGLIALAKGCTKLERLKVRLTDISNEALECLGTHLKNLRKFCMHLANIDGTTYLPLDNGIQAILMGCSKLERLDISLERLDVHGGLTDVGLEYIAKYGANLRSLSLTCIGNSNAGLVKLSEGCPKLRKLKLEGCPFSEQVVTRYVFNIPSLRYVWFDNTDCEISDRESSDRGSSDHESSDRESSDRYRDGVVLVLTRPEFPL